MPCLILFLLSYLNIGRLGLGNDLPMFDHVVNFSDCSSTNPGMKPFCNRSVENTKQHPGCSLLPRLYLRIPYFIP